MLTFQIGLIGAAMIRFDTGICPPPQNELLQLWLFPDFPLAPKAGQYFTVF